MTLNAGIPISGVKTGYTETKASVDLGFSYKESMYLFLPEGGRQESVLVSLSCPGYPGTAVCIQSQDRERLSAQTSEGASALSANRSLYHSITISI